MLKANFLFGLVLNFNVIRCGLVTSSKGVATYNYESEPETCEIFCHGRLLHTIQMAQLYPDSKTFVDMKLKDTPAQTLKAFDDMMAAKNNTPSKDDLKQFVEDNFEKSGTEFEDWDPSDWKENPKFLQLVYNSELRSWGSNLNHLWKMLGRKMIKDVALHPELYSIIYVENPVIVPGGRFKEFYYWDSYWIVRGLLYSEMYTTTRGMLSNFLSIVERFGFIPNGGRVYYSKRSQPPLLAAMIQSYIEFTGDDEFAIKSVDILEHEFEFWMNNHTHEINGHILAAYGDASTGPRPESYSEDVKTAEIFETDAEKEECYSELKAAAESGMDFSSRWFIVADGSNNGTLKDLKTRSIIPVELNAILFWNAKIIAGIHSKSGNIEKANQYETKAQEIYRAIQAVLWDEDVGAWLDYDMINNKRRNYFVPTNLAPLWMKCYNISDTEHIASRVLKYINDTGIDQYPGGVPNTLSKTGEQWDFPNVWPPMQYLLIEGLEKLGTKETKELAYKWAERWTLSNYKAFKDTTHMFEKYDAEEFGGHGKGGEYEVQLGFGWSNGVVIEFLAKYGDKLRVAGGSGVGLKTFFFGGAATAVLAVLATILGRSLW
ncbi:trehalase isoform X2 [Hermetia illucens]|uniref:trehalase isoform X2 n=1 Tax=Hermetia illucens TaxID=343691 RepID=UPI0018CC1004|nr:trehalase isoform X2 [Hermetia illucens]XP_037913973.1 trehalase isoform X2 [Hermetia illucens]XP_037913974.1 trehalase isoform X2 [Hermetia illucens]XP_037913975.1 trehalase isoform X2 [Hermetia illucens]XP_037913976.1 trehalase isoform X2 [Hermetia illucens]XP_037913977.1 trehalase isoform X2 [Hermetia illucens]